MDTQILKKNPSGHPQKICGISNNLNLKLITELFHLLIIPMTLFNDIMPYFDEFIHVYGCNMSIFVYPLKIWTQLFNFTHPVSKSRLRHWSRLPEFTLSVPNSNGPTMASCIMLHCRTIYHMYFECACTWSLHAQL